MTARRCSRLVLAAQKCFLEYFVAGTSARSAAEIIGVNRNTATLFYRKRWEIIAGHNAPEEKIEVDESYSADTVKTKEPRSAAGKVAVFGLLKPGGHVHAVMIPDAGSGKREAGSGKPMSLIRRKIRPDSIVYSDVWHAYRTIDISGFLHERISHASASARAKPYQRHRGLLETGEASLNTKGCSP